MKDKIIIIQTIKEEENHRGVLASDARHQPGGRVLPLPVLPIGGADERWTLHAAELGKMSTQGRRE